MIPDIALGARVTALKMEIHPLVLFQLSDAHTRSLSTPLFGILLGTLDSKTEIVTSFEILRQDLVNGSDFLSKRLQLSKQVAPALEMVGWYCINDQNNLDFLTIHKELFGVDPCVFLLYNPFNLQPEIPIQLFQADETFHQISYSVKINNIQRIALESVSKSTGNNQDNWLSPQLTSQVNALKMLLNQLNILSKYLTDVSNEKLEIDFDILREIKRFLNHLAQQMPDPIRDYLLKEQENISLMNLWSVVFKSTQMMNTTIEKFLTTSFSKERKKSLGSSL